MKDGKPVIKTDCEMCFACIHNCKARAIGYRAMKSEKWKKYFNPNVNPVELAEMKKRK